MCLVGPESLEGTGIPSHICDVKRDPMTVEVPKLGRCGPVPRCK